MNIEELKKAKNEETGEIRFFISNKAVYDFLKKNIGWIKK